MRPLVRLLAAIAVLARTAYAVSAVVSHILLESKTQGEYAIAELGKVGGLRPPNDHLETVDFELLAHQLSGCITGTLAAARL